MVIAFRIEAISEQMYGRGFKKGHAKDLEGTDLFLKLVGDYTGVQFIISLNGT